MGVLTVDEVNALIPKLTELVDRLRALDSELLSRTNELERLGYNPAATRHPGDVPPEIRERLRLLGVAVSSFEAEVRRLEHLGGVLQDLQLGLVDFHHHLDGRDVFLCWQYGERSVRHFHALEAGFSARRALPIAP